MEESKSAHDARRVRRENYEKKVMNTLLKTLLTLVAFASLASIAGDGLAKSPVSTSPAMTAEETAGLEGLGAANRAAAEKQKTCPVTDALLGSMGTPVKVTVKGRTVFLLCRLQEANSWQIPTSTWKSSTSRAKNNTVSREVSRRMGHANLAAKQLAMPTICRAWVSHVQRLGAVQ